MRSALRGTRLHCGPTYLNAAWQGVPGDMMDCIRMQATLAIVLWAPAMTGTLTT
jgi:hypothetical protein